MPGVPYPIEMVNGVPVVAAPQEIDIHNADQLLAVLLEAAVRGRARFVVDMTRTRFCASSGIGVLVQAHKRALADGGELRLVMPTDYSVLSVFAITGIDRVIPNFTSLDEALEPAPATAARPPRRRPKPGMRTPADQPPADPDASTGPP
jgi:anti-sigma B factor antagonist